MHVHFNYFLFRNLFIPCYLQAWQNQHGFRKLKIFQVKFIHNTCKLCHKSWTRITRLVGLSDWFALFFYGIATFSRLFNAKLSYTSKINIELVCPRVKKVEKFLINGCPHFGYPMHRNAVSILLTSIYKAVEFVEKP